MRQYETRVGLEIHVELKTKSKIFCGCSTQFGAKPNRHVCPVCLGLPGALPVFNRQVAEHAIKIGLALGCTIAEQCVFDRKNYFYPDNPQNYQISQLYAPIAYGGCVPVDTAEGTKNIRIHEMHMEEDAGKLVHEESTGLTLVDYNRSGVSLVEIVTEPDFTTAEEVVAFLEKLRLRIQYLGASDCRMQEGSLRVDVNLSVRPKGQETLGTRTEMKNLNSFRSVQAAIAEETKRQIAALESGESIVQETRRWNEETNTSVAMRRKETAADYRYYPDPDLLPLCIDSEWIARCKNNQPEFREEKILRYQKEYGLPEYDARIITSSVQMALLFERTTALCERPKEVSNWLMTETLRLLRENGQDGENLSLSAEHLSALILLVEDGKINRTIAKEVFEAMFLRGAEPVSYVEENDLFLQQDTEELEKAIKKVLTDFPQSVSDYCAGKEKALGFLVGQTMKAVNGKADPKVLRELIRECLQIDAGKKA